MFEHTTEAEARKQILDLVADYCDTFHKKKEYKEGGPHSICVQSL